MVKYHAKGSTFTWNSVVVGQCRSINWTRSNETADVTDLTDSHMTFVAGIPDNGEISLTLWLDPVLASQTALEDDFEAATVRAWIIIWSDTGVTTRENATAYITSYEEAGTVDGALELNLTIKISGSTTSDNL